MLAAFLGTTGDDVVVVTFESGAPRFVEINGTTFDNNDATATIDLLDGNDQISFVGDAFDIDIDAAPGQTKGSVNAVFDFDYAGRLTVISGDQPDNVRLLGGDLITTFQVSLQTGAGNDVVTFVAGTAQIEMGDGDDTLRLERSQIDGLSLFRGGDGFDTWEFLDGVRGRVELRGVTNGQPYLGFDPSPGDQFGLSGRYYEIEMITAPDPTTLDSPNTVFPYFSRGSSPFPGLNWKVNGNLAIGTNPDTLTPLILKNFNKFAYDRDATGVQAGTISIVDTNYPLSTRNFQRVEIGFMGNARSGDTSGIEHEITVEGASLTISDFLGDENNVRLDRDGEFDYRITGLAPADIVFSADRIVDLALWGSDSNVDRFFIEANEARLTLYGNGGDDAFFLGGSSTFDLDQLKNDVINVDGGTGRDQVYLRDQNSSGANSYRIKERWVFPSGDATREFVGVWFTNVYNVSIDGNEQPDEFRVTPVLDNSFQFNGNSPLLGDGDTLTLIGDLPEYQLLASVGTYWFGNEVGDLRPIRYSGIENLDGLGLVAAGSTAGTRAYVEVFDAKSQDLRYTLEPYNDGFLGGVNVATGNIDHFPGPDVVVGTASKGNSRINVYRSFDATQISSFLAFEDFYGGVDVAVGNVLGDATNEIIVSKLDGGNEVRVFSLVISPTFEFTFELAMEYNPFPNSPDIGSRIASGGDINGDGFDDIIAVAGPGWLPQVTVYDVSSGQKRQISRFLANTASDTNGLYISAGNFVGDLRTDVIVSSGPTASTSDPFSSRVRFFSAESLPANAGNLVLEPTFQLNPLNVTAPLSTSTWDIDQDGLTDRLYIAQLGPQPDSPIDVFNREFQNIDQFFTENESYLQGIELG